MADFRFGCQKRRALVHTSIEHKTIWPNHRNELEYDHERASNRIISPVCSNENWFKFDSSWFCERKVKVSIACNAKITRKRRKQPCNLNLKFLNSFHICWIVHLIHLLCCTLQSMRMSHTHTEIDLFAISRLSVHYIRFFNFHTWKDALIKIIIVCTNSTTIESISYSFSKNLPHLMATYVRANISHSHVFRWWFRWVFCR